MVHACAKTRKKNTATMVLDPTLHFLVRQLAFLILMALTCIGGIQFRVRRGGHFLPLFWLRST